MLLVDAVDNITDTGANWLELLLTPKIKSKAFLSSSDKVPASIWLPLELRPSV